MCGIVACLGSNDTINELLTGLRSLEYRGYDSAGLAWQTKQGIKTLKTVGGVDNLADQAPKVTQTNLGIGHTRWATHGLVSKLNAHPHSDDQEEFFVVHNGIIENFAKIKQFLEKKGQRFKSATDSEVIPQLLAYNYQKTKDVRSAFTQTLHSLRGAYAIAMITSHAPDRLWGARLGGPLVVGVGDDRFYLASDALALADKTDRIIVLNDYELVEIDPQNHLIINFRSEQTVDRSPEIISLAASEAPAGDFSDFMSQEIWQIPQVIRQTGLGRLHANRDLLRLGGFDSVALQLRHIDRLIIVGCGTSYYAGLIGEYLIEQISHLPVEVQLASEFKYRSEPLSRSTAVLAISQSGETADVIAALNKVSDSGMLKLGIVNVVGSTISRLTDAGVYCRAGWERSVASTKAFAAQIVVLLLIALYLGKDYPDYRLIIKGLKQLPDQLEDFLESQQIEVLAKKYAKVDSCLFLGRRYTYPVALEGALKLKEISYIHAEGLAAGEIKHGPLALIDPQVPTVVLAPSNDIYDKTCNAISEIKARQGPVIAIIDDQKGQAAALADEVILVPKVCEQLQPIVTGGCLPTAGLLCGQGEKAADRQTPQPSQIRDSRVIFWV